MNKKDYELLQYILVTNCNNCYGKNHCAVGIKCPVFELLGKLSAVTGIDLKLECTESFIQQ